MINEYLQEAIPCWKTHLQSILMTLDALIAIDATIAFTCAWNRRHGLPDKPAFSCDLENVETEL